MTKSDAAAIAKIDRLLERDLYIEWAIQSSSKFGPPPEILATHQNPSRKMLAADRFKAILGQLSGTAPKLRLVGGA